MPFCRKSFISSLALFEERVYPFILFYLGLRPLLDQWEKVPLPGNPSRAEVNLLLFRALFIPESRPAFMAPVEIMSVLYQSLFCPLLIAATSVLCGVYLLGRPKRSLPENLVDMLLPLLAQLLLLVPFILGKLLPVDLASSFELSATLSRTFLIAGSLTMTAGALLSLWALVCLKDFFFNHHPCIGCCDMRPISLLQAPYVHRRSDGSAGNDSAGA